MKCTLGLVGRIRREAPLPPKTSKQRHSQPHSIREAQYSTGREQVETGIVRQQWVHAEPQEQDRSVCRAHEDSLCVAALQQAARIGVFKMQMNQKRRHQA